MILPERVLATFTLYTASRTVRVDSEFEAMFTDSNEVEVRQGLVSVTPFLSFTSRHSPFHVQIVLLHAHP